ncbi:MAG TPA: DedA family protein, partial [Intrasporangium sp.]|nr:DedA family protein [Intrasporangium sp.]
LLGYFLGKSFPGLQDKLEIAVLLIVAVSVMPMIFEYLKHRREANAIAHELGEAVEDIAENVTHHDGRDRP